ncbi:MAG: S8 family serine peptidase [Verrucomicrobiae bacterium]|nr:S8 family serine peptidase [Verrucomicrobiae bacterium]
MSVVAVISRIGLAAGVVWTALLGCGPGFASDRLVWDNRRGSVEAEFRNCSLTNVLQHVAAATGWLVYVEPEAEANISVKFNGLPIGDALRRMLGGFNYALVPGTNGTMRLYVFRTSMADATRPITPAPVAAGAPAPGASRLADELVVRVKPGTDIDKLARALGAKVVGIIPGRNIYRLKFGDAAAAEAARRALGAEPGVESVEDNYAVARPTVPQPVLASSVPALALRLKPSSNNGRLIVGLVDTAVQSLGAEFDAFFLKPVSLAGEAQPDPSAPTHGTSMAYIILLSVQAATGGNASVQILPIDVYGNNPVTTTFDLARGIVEAINGGATIINLSLGTEADSPLLRDIIIEAHRQGVVFYGAAGNAPVDTPYYPAAYPEVTAVTAGDRNRNIAPFANHGEFVDMVAPGASVIHFAGRQFVVGGTSASAAFASGFAAGMADSRRTSPKEVDKLMRTNFAPNKKP